MANEKKKMKHGLLFGYAFSPSGEVRTVELEDIGDLANAQELLWLHFDYTKRGVKSWLKKQAILPHVIVNALTAAETRPRTEVMSQGVLTTLRGVNLNPGADPEDMVSIRIWATERFVITCRHRVLLSIQDVAAAITNGQVPKGSGDLLVMICDHLTMRMASVVDSMDENLDSLDEQVLTAESRSLRNSLAEVRKELVILRRYLAPQREAINRLQAEKIAWLNDTHKMSLRDVVDRVTRYVEDLDSARDRAAVTQEELMSRLSEQVEKRMYVLSIVAAIFLPLSFVTGLLGINVGGIPGGESHWGFAIVSAVSILIVVVELWLFKRNRWL